MRDAIRKKARFPGWEGLDEGAHPEKGRNSRMGEA